ncbi:MAG: hypothetical protein SLAVMIC_00356 [uncultured marine phage]|uniref:Uncharacterized protein n=1 Tax=uncultured marine phage TaxID=707152 RepID=A0A8D9FQP8_9VIRU|nr:MAG: hypothetical protein SLAVMIC_00356 [uncultured marine phage]
MLKIFKYTQKIGSEISEILILGERALNGFISGCVIGKENFNNYQIGHIANGWGLSNNEKNRGFKEIKETVILRSEDKLYTDGRAIIIVPSKSTRDCNNLTIIEKNSVKRLLPKKIYYTDNGETMMITILDKNGMMYSMGYKRINEVKFKSK